MDATEVPDELLRPALEVAFAVAVVGARQRPPIAAPPLLRPFLKLQKLPDRALAPVRKVLENDDEFRERVGSVASVETVDELGLLWLQRPAGWEDAVAALVATAGAEAAEADAERADRTARRRVDAAEEAARRAQAELAAAKASLSTVTGLLEAERDRRALAEAARDKVLARAGELERAIERASRRLDDADMAASVARGRVLELEAALEQSRGPDQEGFDRAAVVSAIERACEALADAGRAAAGNGAERETLARPDPRASRRKERPRRVAAVLPGLSAETREAAEWLVRLKRVLVIVDGYNVAKSAWPDESLSEQRSRLVDALSELHARYHTPLHVVFDGDGSVSPGFHRRGVRVTYSPAGVIADDEIMSIISGLAIDRPVVVVTDDAELRERARAAGANLLAVAQLLSVVGR
ncbi:MAG: NYN domain-containing protein [Acidimicrobiales bacterium]